MLSFDRVCYFSRLSVLYVDLVCCLLHSPSVYFVISLVAAFFTLSDLRLVIVGWRLRAQLAQRPRSHDRLGKGGFRATRKPPGYAPGSSMLNNVCSQVLHTTFNQLATSMKEPLEAFKAARLFSPAKLQQLKPSVSTLDTLSVFPFLRSEIPALKEELPLYMAASGDIDPSYDPLLFWKQHEPSSPTWSQAARQRILVQPSSAASERVFSLLRNSFGERPNSALQDYIKASIMMQCNNR